MHVCLHLLSGTTHCIHVQTPELVCWCFKMNFYETEFYFVFYGKNKPHRVTDNV